jgi:hypothetical protein
MESFSMPYYTEKTGGLPPALNLLGDIQQTTGEHQAHVVFPSHLWDKPS